MGVVFETFTRDLIAVFVVFVSFVVYFVHQRYSHWQRKGLPFIPPVFPFGSFKDPFLQKKAFCDHSIELYRQNDEPVVGIWTAFRPTLFVRDPEIARSVLVKDFSTFHDRGLRIDEENDPITGHLLFLPGEKWRRLRSKLSPTFTSGKLKAMFSTIVDCGGPLDNLIDGVAAKEETLEVREVLAEYTTNIIASVAFGIDINCIDDPKNSFRKYGRKVFEPSTMNGLRAGVNFLFPNLMTMLRIKSIDTDVEQFMINVVKENMEYREKNNVTRKDFFQLLLQLRNTGSIQEDDNFGVTEKSSTKSLSINECAAQAFVFFLAGFETSSTTISFALYELARNPDCQRRVQQEIDEAIARHDGQITYDSVAEMKYLDWCIDETLRMYPPVPHLNREASTAWTIPNTNITIDKGTSVIIPAMALQHDEKYWPNPEQFIPERFSPEQSAGKTFVDRPYMPFGEGPHNCIGLRLGKLQSKVGLITMLQKYSYELAGASKNPLAMSKSSFFLNPVGGINLKITRRNK